MAKSRFNNLIRDAKLEAVVNTVLDEVYSNPAKVAILPARNSINWSITSSRTSRGGKLRGGYAFVMAQNMFNRGENYFKYVVYHELGHVSQMFTNNFCDHGPTFMNAFKILCPVELQHFEYEYKPRMAARCGVARKVLGTNDVAAQITSPIYIKATRTTYTYIAFERIKHTEVMYLQTQEFTYTMPELRKLMEYVINNTRKCISDTYPAVAMFANSARISVSSTPHRVPKGGRVHLLTIQRPAAKAA
jgi:hypothetical protein